jgi:hypothetical protein
MKIILNDKKLCGKVLTAHSLPPVDILNKQLISMLHPKGLLSVTIFKEYEA